MALPQPPPEEALSDTLGLSGSQAAARLVADGPNVLPRARQRSRLVALAAQMVHFFALMLWVAAALAWIANLPELALAIAVVVVVNGVFAFVQEHRADRAAAELSNLLPPQVRVFRDGRPIEVPADQLVMNDVVLLEPGDRISADLRLDLVAGLAIDESMLTGESLAIRPDIGDCAYAGTFVVEGFGRGHVSATGPRTRLASIAALTRAAKRPMSPLTRQLHRVVRTISWIAISAGILAYAALILLGTPTPQGFLFAIGVTVALVPEGLLPTVTLSLARAAQVMAGRKALVRRLEAVESLGMTTYICSDKTGTITSNQMNVVRIWTPEGEVEIRGEGYAPEAEVSAEPRALRAARNVAISAANCVSGHAAVVDGAWVAKGDPMDVALHVAQARLTADLARPASTIGITDPHGLHGPPGKPALEPELRRVPFDPTARCSGAVGPTWVHLLGAAEAVVPRCGRGYLSESSGCHQPEEVAARATAALAAAGDAGLRVLAVARADRTGSGIDDGRAPWECTGLDLLGLVCLEDPPREGVAEALVSCRRAGIKVAMLTGDHPRTAAAIARTIGLSSPEGSVLQGHDLPADDAELGALLDTDGVVVARITPEGKLRVARALQQRNHIVAMTGDGVNDGPALRQADIGIAMGIGGTDVARSAADVVLLDDHFATIVGAVALGRATWANVRRFLTYHLTDNVAELTPFVVWSLSAGNIPLALGVLQILALDIGTDLLPALALGAEPASNNVMNGRLRTDSLLDGRLLRRVFGVLGPTEALLEMIAFLGVLLAAGWTLGAHVDTHTLAAASGAAFIAVVLGQLANAVACRSESRWFGAMSMTSNPFLVWALAVEMLVLAVFIFVAPVASVLGGSSPPPIGWILAGLAIPAVLLADTLHKYARTRRGTHRKSAPSLRKVRPTG